jgi:CpeT protein
VGPVIAFGCARSTDRSCADCEIVSKGTDSTRQIGWIGLVKAVVPLLRGAAVSRISSHILLIVILGSTMALGLEAQKGSRVEAYNDLRLPADWMTGSFSGEAQAMQDRTYFEVRLQMVRIWPQRNGGFWLYVEQALDAALDRPYRQRVHHLEHMGGQYHSSAVYSLRDPSLFRGAWQRQFAFNGIAPDDLDNREGCTIVLRKHEDRFIGNTVGRLCGSTLHGVSYATSEVEIREGRLISWDRGSNEIGEHVWGATKGGYVFEKAEDYPLE